MEAQEMRELSGDELRDKEATLRESLFRLRFKLSLGEIDAVKNYREARKDLARLKTVQRQRAPASKRG